MTLDNYIDAFIEIKNSAPFSVNELAKRLNINHMTIHRIINEGHRALSTKTERNIKEFVDRYNQRKIENE